MKPVLAILRVYDQIGKLKNTIDLPSGVPVFAAGEHQLRFSCEFTGESASEVTFEVKSMGRPESIAGLKE